VLRCATNKFPLAGLVGAVIGAAVGFVGFLFYMALITVFNPPGQLSLFTFFWETLQEPLFWDMAMMIGGASAGVCALIGFASGIVYRAYRR
jgi:hypothetical protein